MSRTPFQGNCPHSVSKDAKYRVKREEGKWVVQLLFRINRTEAALLATRDHPHLVKLVNEIKDDMSGQPGGAFYINEYAQVLVPAGDDYYCAGVYKEPLSFDFNGGVISAKPPIGLHPGALWNGPHVGIPYVLSAGAKDIKYERKQGQRIFTELLSLHTTGHNAKKLAGRLALVKGLEGGRIYINERREFFAPRPSTTGVEYVYLGALGDAPWFQPPSGSG